ncbi:TGF-beta receptor type-2-like isoform X1 [Ranitomeya variabilis]|uniref:TGF-beta receptor type-2-like isoform X1 n=2 Tax=Ranitomeya variabilis TaxID=490064 RepID=UPI004057ADAD
MGVCGGTTTLIMYLSLAAAHRNTRTNLCKWCDNSHPVCEGGICYTNCSLSSYCETAEEICVTIWKQHNDSVQVKTLCHHPQLPLENILLPMYNTVRCVMQAMAAESQLFFICGCVEEQECNDKLIFYNQSDGYSLLHSREAVPVAAISLLPPFLLAISVTGLFYLYRIHRLRKRPKSWPKRAAHSSSVTLHSRRPGQHSCQLSSSLMSSSQCNISTACANSINHNTELLPIQLDHRVGKGRFAEVWKAKLKHAESGHYEMVAVKIFPAQEFASWMNESNIFTDANLKHENVLQFITMEEHISGTHKEYWIITAYHARGSLKDYLSRHRLSWKSLLDMAGSIVSGVAHLHSDYTPCGTSKVAIAHRDIKSSNILVKNNSECALCDFGIALRLDPVLTADDFANSGQVGTARYMAPEVLESRVNLEDLESFKQMDVYSLALVLWEMASRCEAIEVKNYELPFGSMVQEPPCVETMRDLVLHGRGRPDIPTSWRGHAGLDVLCDTISECWDHDPEARLTAHCVAERFILMRQMDAEGRTTSSDHHYSQC